MEKNPLSQFLFPAWTDFPDIELYMDQVIGVLEKHLSPYYPDEKCITSTMINNYVKQKLIPPPQNKRYGRGQLARLYMICTLKSFMQLSDICALLDHLGKTRSEEEVFRLFSTLMENAVVSIGAGEKIIPPKNGAEQVLYASLRAFAAILLAKSVYREVSGTLTVADTDEKKEPKKEKKEKKKSEKA